MKCVICLREGGNDEKGVITLQSTSHGSVCPRCIDQLVGDVIQMRRPWSLEDLKEWFLIQCSSKALHFLLAEPDSFLNRWM